VLLASAGFVQAMWISRVLAQAEQGTITGTVTDESGAVVARAKVVVVNVQTVVSAETETNSEGYYRVPYLPPGQYEVRAEAPGFSKGRVSGVNLTVGLTATINITLKPGAVRQEVTVTASAVQLEQQSSSLGNVVGTRQLTELPLLGRNPYSLVTLAPGVVDRGNAGSGPIINGGRSNTSEILLDGAETRNSTTNDIAYRPPLEATQEFKVITNNFSAEYGRSGGGVLTAATRSGTNHLHGSIYEFVRNEKLNAVSWTTNRSARPDPSTGKAPRDPFKHNEYGFAVGGPAYLPRLYDGRNRTFFFVNWEKIPESVPENIQTSVPDALQRAGDFSQTLTSSGQSINIFDPATTRPDPNRPGNFIRDQFTCGGRLNVICPDRLDPIALKVLQFYPLPNRPGLVNNFFQAATRRNDAWRLFFRVDHNLGSKHRLFFSHGRETSDRFTPGINPAFPSEGVNGEKGLIGSRPRSAVLSDAATFRPNLVGEFRASLTRNVIRAVPRSVGFDFAQLGFPQSLKNQAGTLLFPRFEASDVSSLGPDRASFFTDAEQAEEFQAHATWVRSTHSLKSGFDFTFQTFNVFRPERRSGFYSFGRAFTQGPDPRVSSSTAGYGFATFLLGAPTGGQISADPSLATSQKFYAWYLQDDWKLLHNLTLNLGVRWEYQTPWKDRFDQLAFFDPNFVDPTTQQKGLLRFAGRDGNPRYQSDPERKNFAPRLGLAWQFTKDTVLHAGYGVFYFPGSGGIGAGASDLGSGFLAQTPVFLGPPPAAPNTPPPGASLANSFQAGFFTPPTTGVGGGLGTAFRKWETPFNQAWNVSIQRVLARDLLVEVAYVGGRGERIWINRNRNAVSTQFLPLGTALDDLVPNPFFGKIGGFGASATVRRSQLLRPFPHYTDVSRFRDGVGDSIYHGFTLRVDKRMGHGLLLQAAYTVSKQIDDVQERFGGRTSFIDPNNLKLSRSLGDFDQPQILVLNYIYELPFGRGKKWLGEGLGSQLLGNWQLSGITRFAKGFPMVITAPASTGLPGVGATPVRLKSPVLSSGQQSLDRWFDTTAFRPAPPFSLGSDSRTEPNLRIPGTKIFDLGLSRTQRIKERVNLQFRAEFFNAFNTPQFNAPQGSVTASDFGRISSAGSPRVIQLGLRLSF
jgi:hypothetical protein